MLNAKRHQRLGQDGVLSKLQDSRLCSTPKGIKGWDSYRYCAILFNLIVCSTPKGIKGWDSRRTSPAYRESICAQRQKASKVGTVPLEVETPTTGECAQRQKASKVGTGKHFAQPQKPRPVLNAKRHQRLGQPCSAGQREELTGCSTPKGIKGWDRPMSPRLPTTPASAQRQKASKVGTGNMARNSSQSTQCSTPKGIKGWDRVRRIRSFPVLLRAQRQKASKVGTGGWFTWKRHQ